MFKSYTEYSIEFNGRIKFKIPRKDSEVEDAANAQEIWICTCMCIHFSSHALKGEEEKGV